MYFSRKTRTVCSDPTEFLYSPEKKQIHIIGVEQHTDIVENQRYSVDKQNEQRRRFLSFEFFLSIRP
jgi:hypothetical protein